MSDVDLAKIIDKYGDAIITKPSTREVWPYVPVGELVIEMARKHFSAVHRYPVSLGCALVHQESYFRNIFGCDHSIADPWKAPFCQVPVTKKRVQQLIEYYYDPPVGGSNGVGYTQLTSIEFIEAAEKLGGAHIARNQMEVGFKLMASHIKNYGYYGGVGAYNAGPGNRFAVRWTYTSSLEAKHNLWIARLT